MEQAQIIVRKNERSWAIEIISQINAIVTRNDLVIKRAGGESTISNKGKSMFPDVILYDSTDLTNILQGWELKMPDVAITNEEFIRDAQRKARALKRKSCVIWNFTYAQFYVLNETKDSFEVKKQWKNPQIISRNDVALYKSDWEKTLLDVVLTVNDYLTHQETTRTSIGDVISQSAINLLINENKNNVAKYIENEGVRNSVINASIEQWWSDIKIEYQFDETDKYKAYAKNVILNWAYRIIFAHLIKKRQNGALLIDELDYDKSPNEANDIFKRITSRCDFYNVFEPILYGELLPSETWESLVELSLFLKENGIKNINQSMLQNILEGSVNTTRRELNGQFTTPKTLARILASITVHDWTDNCADTCCGTGTIPHEIIEQKKSKIGASKAVETTWASDKYKMPLQIANISMTSCDTINLANRLFQKNAFLLNCGDKIQIVNPQDGTTMEVIVPQFGSICSNLPFVPFENIPDEDKIPAYKYQIEYQLDAKSDLSYYLTAHLAKLLKDNGYLGIITSNAWLGTGAGISFYNTISELFDLEQVHISGKGRWFQNADVVTTILLLKKRTISQNNNEKKTSFFVWKIGLDTISRVPEYEKIIINSSLLNNPTDDRIIAKSEYTKSEIDSIKELNISFNAMFHDILWILDIKDKIIPLKKKFSLFRGSRRGWDDLFFPKEKNEIENEFLLPALFNAKKVDSLIAAPDRVAFSCNKSLEELENNYPGSYKWIMKFSTQLNGKNKPLPEVLKKKKDEEWYEMQPNEVAEIFTMMNPDNRIFFGRFETPSFINQRLIGLKQKEANGDTVLYHALLNSILMKFYIEAVGFGRGLGVLDINKDSIANCYMLNPELLSNEDVKEIKDSFKVIVDKEITDIENELSDTEWIVFNKTVLKAFGIESYYSKISNSLLSLRRVRRTARETYSNVTPMMISSTKIYNVQEQVDYDIAAETFKRN